MNPMSLSTLPAETLRDAASHEQHASPQGEFGRRWLALAVVLVFVSAVLTLALVG